MFAFLIGVNIYLSFGNALEGNEHFSPDSFHFGSVANLEIIEDVIVHVALGIGRRSLFRAVDDDPVLNRK